MRQSKKHFLNNKTTRRTGKIISLTMSAMLCTLSAAGPFKADEVLTEYAAGADEALTEQAIEADEALTEGTAGADEALAEQAIEADEALTEGTAEEDEAGNASGSDIALKDETVYVIADPAGNVSSLISSSHLLNPDKADTLTDRCILSDIENLKGEEPFTQGENGMLTWDARGNDIYYRAEGTGAEAGQLPVSVAVTYTLDGKEINAEELEGKSGDLTVRFDYRETEMKDPVPFTALTGMILDDDHFYDVEVTGGRLVNDGERMAVVGIAFPGLAQALDTEDFASLTSLVDLPLPEYVQIHAQVKDYEASDVYTIITNEVFTENDLDLPALIDQADGALSSLDSGITTIADGVNSLKDGAGELKNGASDVAKGLGKLTEENETLLGGAGTVFSTLLETASAQLSSAGIPLPEKLTQENYSAALEAAAEQLPEEKAGPVLALKDQLDQYQAFYDGLSAYTDGVSQAKEGADQVSDGAASLAGGAMKLSLGTTILKAALPDLGNAKEAMNKLIENTKAYNTFSGLSEGMKGKVRFVWVTR